MADNRRDWSKLNVPFELGDMLNMIASKHGYKRAQIHLFLYRILKTAYPEDVAALAAYLETAWMDEKPPDE